MNSSASTTGSGRYWHLLLRGASVSVQRGGGAGRLGLPQADEDEDGYNLGLPQADEDKDGYNLGLPSGDKDDDGYNSPQGDGDEDGYN